MAINDILVDLYLNTEHKFQKHELKLPIPRKCGQGSRVWEKDNCDPLTVKRRVKKDQVDFLDSIKRSERR